MDMGGKDMEGKLSVLTVFYQCIWAVKLMYNVNTESHIGFLHDQSLVNAWNPRQTFPHGVFTLIR